MQGAVYCWVKNNDGKPFAVRDLVSSSWEGTPLQVLYDRHVEKGKEHDAAFASAAQDLGWLVKSALDADQRKFKGDKADVSMYACVESAP
jgi:hypothetical protein